MGYSVEILKNKSYLFNCIMVKAKPPKVVESLVDILNKVPYISDISSLRGKYYTVTKHGRHIVSVGFRVEENYDSEFESLICIMLLEQRTSFPNVILDVTKNYVLDQNNSEVEHFYRMCIMPLVDGYAPNDEESRHLSFAKHRDSKERIITKAISSLVEVISSYVTNLKNT